MSETTDTPAQAAPTAPPAGAPPAAPPADAAPPASLLDLAEEAKPGATEAARPDWLPEQFWDPDKKAPRLESMAKSWADFRNRLAKGGHTPPESPDAYRLPAIEGLPADLVKSDDPLWTEVRTAAHKAGLTPAQLEAVAAPYLAAVAKQQADAGRPPDPEAERRAREAEVARLGPQGKQVLAEVKGWIAGLESRGVLSAEETRDLRESVWSANQVRALAKLRALSGERPIPVTALEDGSMTVEDAKRMLRDGLATNDRTLADRARRALTEMEAKGLLKAG